MSAQSAVKYWREDPVRFVRDVFGVEPDLWQIDTLEALGGELTPRRRLAMKACTGPGKSAVLAWIGWHRLVCFAGKGEHPKGVAISGEGRDNLRDNLWAELSKWQHRSDFLMDQFTWNKEQIYANAHPQTWFLSARSYPKNANTEEIGRSLSGLHSKFPFILLDETGGMPIQVGQKAEQIFTGGVEDGLIAQAGNPTSTTGLLYHTCTNDRDRTVVITITADPNDSKRTPRVDKDHAREQIEKYGRDNPWVMATILGLFPPGGINTLISLETAEAATKRKADVRDYEYSQKRLGVDVARFGDDRTIIFPRQGLQSFNFVEMRAARSNEIAGRVMMAKDKWKSEVEFVDGTGGWGSGVIDSLIQARHSPVEVNFSGKSNNSKYYNKRAEMWFDMAEWLERGGVIPNNNQLIKELVSPTYTIKNGKFLLEPKDQIKDRLGYSPDIADALALTFAHPEMPAKSDMDILRDKIRGERGKALTDFNPLDY